MATKAVFSAKAGLLLYFLFRGLPVLSAVKVGRAAYSTAECSWQACGISARHCLASTFGGHTRSSPIILLLLGYSRSALLNLHLRTDAVLFANLARLFSSIRFTIALGRVIIHFSVAKLVCSRVRLKSLGQWRSLTNLPLSSLWF